MQYVTLSNGVKMPQLGYGVYQVTQGECERCVMDALSVGYRHLDTAQSYFNEEQVGSAIKKSGVPREEIFLTTKVWVEHYGYDECRKSVENSLKKLQTDYIDLMLLHQPFSDYYGAWRALEDLYDEGVLKSIGVSNFDENHLKKLLANCDIKPAIMQVECHPYYQQKALRELLKRDNIVLESWYPLGSGDSGLLGEETIKTLANKHGKTAAQIVLKWHIQEGFVAIPGSKNPIHIVENAEIFDFELDEEDMNLMRALDRNKRFYNVPKAVQKVMFTLGKINFDKQP